MELLLGAVLGAIFGVIVAAIFQRSLEHWFDRRGTSLRRAWYRLRGESIPLPQPETFVLAGRKFSFVVVDGDGEHAYTPDTITCSVDHGPLSLPVEVRTRRTEIEARENAVVVSSIAAPQHVAGDPAEPAHAMRDEPPAA